MIAFAIFTDELDREIGGTALDSETKQPELTLD